MQPAIAILNVRMQIMICNPEPQLNKENRSLDENGLFFNHNKHQNSLLIDQLKLYVIKIE